MGKSRRPHASRSLPLTRLENITMTSVLDILIRGIVVLVVGAVVMTIILFIVGETIEHFTPY